MASASASIPGAELVLGMGGCRRFLSGSLLLHLVLMESAGAVEAACSGERVPGLLVVDASPWLVDMGAIIEFPMVSGCERCIVIGP